MDNLLSELGGERLMKLTCGDELAGQEQAFKQWAADVFNVSLNSRVSQYSYVYCYLQQH